MSTEFCKNGVVKTSILEDNYQAIIDKNNITICPNFILDSRFVTGGGGATGITSEYLSDGTLKITTTSDNGNWRSLSFPRDSNTSVGANLAVGDTYTISLDIKLEGTNGIPSLFINSGNGYKSLQGDKNIQNTWQRVYYTSTWATPGTSYGNISLHLGFSGLAGVFYVKNFKLEKSAKPTPWIPNSTDAIYTSLNYGSLNTTIVDPTHLSEIIEN